MTAKVVHLVVISLSLFYSSSSASKETKEVLKSNKNLNISFGMEEKGRTSNEMDERRETEGNLTRITLAFSSTLIPEVILGGLSDMGVSLNEDEVNPNPRVTMVLFILLFLALSMTALFYFLVHLCHPCALPKKLVRCASPCRKGWKSPYEEI